MGLPLSLLKVLVSIDKEKILRQTEVYFVESLNDSGKKFCER